MYKGTHISERSSHCELRGKLDLNELEKEEGGGGGGLTRFK